MLSARYLTLGAQRQARISTLALQSAAIRFHSDVTTESKNETVYHSPLGHVVTRLRGVSLATGLIGSIGLPLIVAAKGGDLPSTGLLAVGMTFVAGTMGSTAAIHFVFSPYVYTIERIPIRLCLYKKKKEAELKENGVDISEEQLAAMVSDKTNQRPMLYKAVSKTLFLTRIETVFDPACDVTPYQGLRPMCNFTAKGRPLYVHPEYVYDTKLRETMQLGAETEAKPMKDNPDDFL